VHAPSPRRLADSSDSGLGLVDWIAPGRFHCGWRVMMAEEDVHDANPHGKARPGTRVCAARSAADQNARFHEAVGARHPRTYPYAQGLHYRVSVYASSVPTQKLKTAGRTPERKGAPVRPDRDRPTGDPFRIPRSGRTIDAGASARTRFRVRAWSSMACRATSCRRCRRLTEGFSDWIRVVPSMRNQGCDRPTAGWLRKGLLPPRLRCPTLDCAYPRTHEKSVGI
jgi:hypothetical protein